MKPSYSSGPSERGAGPARQPAGQRPAARQPAERSQRRRLPRQRGRLGGQRSAQASQRRCQRRRPRQTARNMFRGTREKRFEYRGYSDNGIGFRQNTQMRSAVRLRKSSSESAKDTTSFQPSVAVTPPPAAAMHTVAPPPPASGTDIDMPWTDIPRTHQAVEFNPFESPPTTPSGELLSTRSFVEQCTHARTVRTESPTHNVEHSPAVCAHPFRTDTAH